MGRRSWVAVPVAAALLAGADRAAWEASRPHDGPGHDHGGVLELESRGRLGLFPALRALLFQVWFIRIDADIRAGHLHKALRHAREALAFAPDMPEARSLLASVLAFDLAARERETSRRLAWVEEGLRVLDEGLAREPADASLHHMRGVLLDNRARTFPEYAAAFRETYGEDPLDSACASFVEAAEYGRGTGTFLLHASWALMTRGDRVLDLARDRGDASLLEAAAASYDRGAGYSREFLQRVDRGDEDAREEFEVVVRYCETSAALCRRYLALAAGEAVDRAEIEALLRRRDELIPPGD